MKRIVVLIDGTWNKEGTTCDTNVAKLDSASRIVDNAFVRDRSSDGTLQHVHYHDGVGTEGDIFRKLLGGAVGPGLKEIILDCYAFLADDYDTGDEIYIFGFSRGAYAARALAGLIGASGIPRRTDAALFEAAWQHYRVNPATRQQPQRASETDHRILANIIRQRHSRPSQHTLGQMRRRVGYGRLVWYPSGDRACAIGEIFCASHLRVP